MAFAKKAGGDNGFFALALSPGVALRHPKISISGVKTSEIAPQVFSGQLGRGTQREFIGPLGVIKQMPDVWLIHHYSP